MSELDAGDINQAVDDGIDGQASGGMDLELAGDVAAMGDDGVNGDTQMVGNFLVRHALNQ